MVSFQHLDPDPYSECGSGSATLLNNAQGETSFQKEWHHIDQAIYLAASEVKTSSAV
jgi:hypothetical protein